MYLVKFTSALQLSNSSPAAAQAESANFRTHRTQSVATTHLLSNLHPSNFYLVIAVLICSVLEAFVFHFASHLLHPSHQPTLPSRLCIIQCPTSRQPRESPTTASSTHAIVAIMNGFVPFAGMNGQGGTGRQPPQQRHSVDSIPNPPPTTHRMQGERNGALPMPVAASQRPYGQPPSEMGGFGPNGIPRSPPKNKSEYSEF